MFTFRRRPAPSPARRRAVRLRLESFEERTVPAVGVGVNVSSFGSFSVPAVGNGGSVSPDHYVQILVGRFAVYSKTGALLQQKTDAAFWQAAGIPLSTIAQGLAQPRVVYDPLSTRWFAMETSLEDTNNQVLIARSDTSDPTGTWTARAYVGRAGSHAGFPTLGIDQNALYVGTADFLSRGLPFPIGSTMTVLPKADLLLATPIITNRTSKSEGASAPMGWGVQAATNFNANPAHATVLATHYDEFDKLQQTDITGTGAAGATFGSSVTLALNPTSAPGKARQPDGTRQISGGDDDRYTGAIVQVGDLIYATHTISVNASGIAAPPSGSTTNAVHLVVVSDSQNAVVAQAYYYNTGFDYIFPSVAANQYGDIVIGYNRSSAEAGDGLTDGRLGAYAVYARINPANPTTITFGDEVQLKAGEGAYRQQGNGTAVEAWGPYSATSLDPSNPTAFWTTLQYARSDVEWRTQVSQVFVSPRAGAVSSTAADGTYGVGASIPITVTFNHDVVVSTTGGTPALALNNGGSAVYTSGSGTNTLTFTYTVGGGQSVGDLDYASTTALGLNGGTIKDELSNLDAELVLAAPGAAGSLGASKNITIDAVQPAVSGVTSPTPDGSYGFTMPIDVTVTFTRPVNVNGTPRIALNAGGTAFANYLSGSDGTTLTFRYTVGSGHFAADLDYASTTALTLNNGTILDAVNGSPAVLTLVSPGAAGSLGFNKDIAVDAAPPRVAGVNSPAADRTYGFGETIAIQVTFDKPVNVSGEPRLALNSGGTAVFSSVLDATVTFTYTVGSGHSSADLDYTSVNALTLNGGTITEAGSGQDATLTLPAPGGTGSLGANKAIVVSAIPARVTNVASPTLNGVYSAGAVIDVTVQFERPVVVSGSPQLALNTGATATFLSATATTLTFRYTVGPGQNTADLDYASTAALSLNGGTIREANNLDANLTLPAPGTAGSLGFNKAISVDTSGPTVVEFRVLFGTKRFNLIGSSRVLPWLVTGVQVVFSEPVYAGNVRSLTGLTATRFSGLRTRTLTWNFPAVAKGSFNTALATTGLNALKDRAGNPVANFSQAFQVLYGDFNGDSGVALDDELGVRAFLSGPYQMNPAGYNIFADLSGDGLVNLVDVNVTKTRRGQTLP